MTDKDNAMFLMELAALGFKTMESALREFTQRQGWQPLGYGSFGEWYRENIRFSDIHKALLYEHGSEEAAITWWLRRHGS